MVRPALLTAVIAVLVLALSPTVSAHDREGTPLHQEIRLARLAYEEAVRDMHYFRFVQHPQAVRDLDHRIHMRRAEIALIEKKLERWEPLDRWRDGRILHLSIENARLELEELQHNLAELQRQQYDLHRQRAQHLRYFLSEIDLRLADLQSLEQLAESDR